MLRPRPTTTPATIARLVLVAALGLGLAACDGGSDGSAPETTAAERRAAAAPLDACAALDAEAIGRVAGVEVGEGAPVAAGTGGSRCEFNGPDGGLDVAVELGRAGGRSAATASPYLGADGFAEEFGSAEPVARLAHDGYGALDDGADPGRAAVVSTDGQEYVLVVLTGAYLTEGDVAVAADLVRDLEDRR